MSTESEWEESVPWRRHPVLNCHKCGRFVGRDGYTGITEVDNGVWEVFYPECRVCLDKAEKRVANDESKES